MGARRPAGRGPPTSPKSQTRKASLDNFCIDVAATFRVYLAFWLFFFMSDRDIGLLRALGFWLPLEDATDASGGTRTPRHLQSTTVVELLWL